MAMSELAPAVTLECGKVGQRHGVEHACSYLDACLHMAEFPQHPVASHDVDLYHTVAVAKVRPELSIGFGDRTADVDFLAELDRLNFRELPAATVLGQVRDGVASPLLVQDEQGNEVADRYFECADGQLQTRCALMPSMLTLDQRVIRQDCLCYIMERYDRHLRDAG
jgi:hypothetical protein